MKFTWKIILIVSVLLGLSLSVSGYSVVRQTLSSRVAQEKTEAQEDMKLFGLTLQALSLHETDGKQDASALVLRTLHDTPALQTSAYGVWDKDGELLTKSGSVPEEIDLPSKIGVIETSFTEYGKETLLISVQPLMLHGELFYIARTRDVTDVFSEAETHLSNFQWIMAGILAVGIALTTVVTLLLTRPIRRISRTAKQLSQGSYDKRVRVTTNDELGQLAQDFNAMADSLEAKIGELADALARQKDFTAGFAHELKTPLTSVIGYADTLRSRVLPPQTQLQAADYIFKEGKRLEAMSHALLDLFALERNEPQFRAVSIAHIVQETVQSCAYLAQKDGIAIDTAVQDASLFVEPELMKTLLYNLIDNARKASSPDSKICITGKPAEKGYLLSVRDFGRGIAPDALSRITEPFYMVDKSRARAQGGAGLGLTLCQRIAQAHHTELQFESAAGKGTLVAILLGGEAQ